MATNNIIFLNARRAGKTTAMKIAQELSKKKKVPFLFQMNEILSGQFLGQRK